jgi:putative methionine-R-sulfoxide reductase with GAF domain
MNDLAAVLKRTAVHLEPHREALVEAWVLALREAWPEPEDDLRDYCVEAAESLFGRLVRGELQELLAAEARAAEDAARMGDSLQRAARAIRVLDGCCLPFLIQACPDREELARCLLALDELGDRRLEALLQAQEDEAGRRLIEAQEQAARAQERARELNRANEALARSERQSRHRAEQIGLLVSVARSIAGILEPERLMQLAAETIQAKLDYTYVAVVVLDDAGVLLGRWAGRPGVGRKSRGRAQGPPGGIIGRALRSGAPQVANDVARDRDYQPDVPGTRSEMVVPLLEGATPVGAIDFQSMEPAAFDLDDVAAAEALAEFVVVGLRNARLFAELKGRATPPAALEEPETGL